MCSLIEIFKRANAIFLRENKSSLEYDLSEPCLCHSLAKSIQAEMVDTDFEGYYDDIEYNRDFGGKIKIITAEAERQIPIKCNLLIHNRGEGERFNNILALEMKKSCRSKEEKDNDRIRLMALTQCRDVYNAEIFTFPEQICGYQLGIYYEIDKDKRQILIEYYKNGQKFDSKVLNY